ncbi:PHB depolymerase family esterase [Pseudofrankia sp. DC12]|uniref:alpha/beta hydrolase family esterase n=1 Tax=Pseudofrankia sp. DC12 TaxID=683315 RepID=UPI0005F79194|nr:PHB depolymerase family esterase [Pseudofrankia sp. DC12]
MPRLTAVAALVAVAAGAAAACGPMDRRAPVAASPSSGTAPQAGTVSHTLTVDGLSRDYAIHVPAGTGTTPLPLVVQLHGGGGNNVNIEKQTGFYDLADQDHFLVASPDGTGGRADRLLTWNAGWCCGSALNNKVGDVAFVAAMLDDLEAHYPVDPRRIYVTGFSNGAMMTYRLGCALAGRIAAIAPVSGALDLDGCAPARPVPLLAIHGTADENVPYDGGKGSDEGKRFPSQKDRVDRSVADSVGFWVKNDGCPAAPAEQRSGSLIRAAYRPCAGGAEVVLDTIVGGVHAWPGGQKIRPKSGEPSDAINATAEIWAFFSAHELPGSAPGSPGAASPATATGARPAGLVGLPPAARVTEPASAVT